MHKGSCLCGDVQYEVDGALGPIVLCHCSRCRKANGSAFNAVSTISAASLHVRPGTQPLAVFESSSGVQRMFCSRCGSPIYSQRASMPDIVRLRIGTLDTAVDLSPAAHIFVASKADWYAIHDDAVQYAEVPLPP